MPQYLEQIQASMKSCGAGNINDFILKSYEGTSTDLKSSALENLNRYACQVLEEPRYRKDMNPGKSIKTDRPLNKFDCIEAPCVTACPSSQGIPDYMYYTAQGEYSKALDVILETNPFPNVTGMVCDHVCTDHCTRNNIDSPLQIREIKRFLAQHGKETLPTIPEPDKDLKIAVIGAGPSGLACAYYLALQGVNVTVYEAKNIAGGQVSATIPTFRLKAEDWQKDVDRIQQLGVNIHYNFKVDKKSFQSIRNNHDFVYVAVGAQQATRLNIEGERDNKEYPGTTPPIPPVTDALTFLALVKQENNIDPGKGVAVIGGGNSAIDAARTAWRLQNSGDSEVTVLYRRSRKEMPADKEEIDALLAEGIQIKELISPVKIERQNNKLILTCWKMKLGEPDESGRRRPVKIEGSDFDMAFDTIISAIGQQVRVDFMDAPVPVGGVFKNIMVGGDALHGPFNIITAIADGKKAAHSILGALQSAPPMASRTLAVPHKRIFGTEPKQLAPDQRRNFQLVHETFSEKEAQTEASRCLLCSDRCDICVTVCPNRANISYKIEPVEITLQKALQRDGKIYFEEDKQVTINQPYQVLNLAEFCNECGNCATFCPTNGAPYKDKPKLCLTKESFQSESSAYFIEKKADSLSITWKHTGPTSEEICQTLSVDKNVYNYDTPDARLILDKKSFRIQSAEFKSASLKDVYLTDALWMSTLLEANSSIWT
jgi:putative selenate reductase